MTHYDVFNGDADGLCSLRQLRLVTPVNSVRITGIKRDVMLLQRVPAVAGDSVTVLDISMDTNRSALLALLERNVTVRYFDHHGAINVPVHPRLQAIVDTTPNICTGIIVDRYLGGAWREWAVAAAFGDNFAMEAHALASTLALSPARIARLQILGECLNYNAYGDTEDDIIVHPAALYAALERYSDPVAFADTEPLFRQIREAREHDLAAACAVKPHVARRWGSVHVLPNQPWSRRIRGDFGNRLTMQEPHRAHAILTPNAQGGFTVSVRAPLDRRCDADLLCRQFPSGGGRPAAAGINHLPQRELPAFVAAFERLFGKSS